MMSRDNGGEVLHRTDVDRRRFLGRVAELPERYGREVHAFVLMDNHYHLLVRCRRSDLSDTLRWLQTAYAVSFNWAHRLRGHVFQGRYKSVLIQDEAALDAVAQYLHLNPVRIGGLGLSKDDQKRAKVMGCADPGAELIQRRLAALREYRWSSWRVNAGLEPAPAWLAQDRIQAGRGGKRLKEQRAAAQARPEWRAIVGAAGSILGRTWAEMAGGYGDWGRDGTLAVATRQFGWRLVDAVREVPGLKYAAAAQGIRRFWRRAEGTEPETFMRRLRAKLSIINV